MNFKEIDLLSFNTEAQEFKERTDIVKLSPSEINGEIKDISSKFRIRCLSFVRHTRIIGLTNIILKNGVIIQVVLWNLLVNVMIIVPMINYVFPESFQLRKMKMSEYYAIITCELIADTCLLQIVNTLLSDLGT